MHSAAEEVIVLGDTSFKVEAYAKSAQPQSRPIVNDCQPLPHDTI